MVLDYPLQQGRCLAGPLDRKLPAIRSSCTDWIPWLRKSSSWSGGRTKRGATRNLVSLGHENETEALVLLPSNKIEMELSTVDVYVATSFEAFWFWTSRLLALLIHMINGCSFFARP